jgi:hypothetical protein
MSLLLRKLLNLSRSRLSRENARNRALQRLAIEVLHWNYNKSALQLTLTGLSATILSLKLKSKYELCGYNVINLMLGFETCILYTYPAFKDDD